MLSLSWVLIYTKIQWNPPKIGHIGIRSAVPCREAVLISEIKINQLVHFLVVICTEVVHISKGPLAEVLRFIGLTPSPILAGTLNLII